VRRARLTRAGMAELRELDRRSDRLAQSILDPLSESQRTSLADAMAEVERLLSASAIAIAEEPPESPDARHCLGEYFGELSRVFEGGFDPARSESPTTESFVPPNGTFLVARLNGSAIGCGAFKPLSPGTVYFKRMWIDPRFRGLGVGRRLLLELEKRARDIGYRIARLETHKSLTGARQLYKNAGYREIAPFGDEQYAHHWFEKSIERSR
jgi:GNAT superfamily N-acetyltransferase